jgi:hypothetical protein
MADKLALEWPETVAPKVRLAESSTVHAVSYEVTTQVLTVLFASGSTYDYYGVPAALQDADGGTTPSVDRLGRASAAIRRARQALRTPEKHPQPRHCF